MDIQVLKNRIKLSELIGHDVRLKKSGREYSGCCPFHQEKSPSFWVNDEKGLYYCFGCGATGDAFTYLTDKKGLHFKDAVIYLADKLGITLPQTFFQQKEEAPPDDPLLVVFEKAACFFEAQLCHPPESDEPSQDGTMDPRRSNNDTAYKYLINRRITPEMIKRFRLGFCPDNQSLWHHLKSQASDTTLQQSGLFVQDHLSRFRGRIIFPIRNHKGQVIAFGGRTLADEQPKYINSTENPHFKKKEILYGFYEGHTLEKKQKYIFVEGYLDVIKLHQHGFTGAVASMGTALTAEHIQKVWRYDAHPIIALDGDAAGQRAQFRSVEKILPFITPYKTITLAEMPDGMDPDQLLDQDPMAFQTIIKEPRSIMDFLWVHFEKALQNTKTPEEIAAVQDEIKQLCNSIQHKDLSRIYFATLNKYIWRYIYKRPTDGQAVHRLTPVKNNRLLSEILLATIVNHPIILDEIHDNLGRAQFVENDLEQLRCQILDGYYNNYDVQTQYAFDTERVLMFAPFVRETTDVESVRMGWWEIWSQLFGVTQSTTDDWAVTCKLKQVYVEDN